MKLNIGENIRKYRRNMNMTQEQFAENIGVSFQAVSRWENGVTYPDMELLPAIAKFFGISVDQLLNIPNEIHEANAKEAIEQLRIATGTFPIDSSKIIKLIRDIRNNYLDTDAFFYFWFVRLDTYGLPEILPEIRLTVEKVLEGNYPQYIKSAAIEHFAEIEDDENIEAFLDKYSTETDTSRQTLLRNRYMSKCQWEKAEAARQLNLANIFDQLLWSSRCWRNMTDPYDIDEAVKVAEIRLFLLNKINDHCSDAKHPISGNGKIDFWVEARINIGMIYACALGMKERTDEAFTVLEDTVTLIEQAMKINEKTTLTCASPWLKDVKFEAQRMPANDNFSENIWVVHDTGLSFFIAPNIYHNILVNCQGYDERFKWFSSLKDDPRYTVCIERLQRLIK